jgi:hypothetical protein
LPGNKQSRSNLVSLFCEYFCFCFDFSFASLNFDLPQKEKNINLIYIFINPNLFLDFLFLLTLAGDGWLPLQETQTFFVDDPRKLHSQRRSATQAKGVETLDPKSEVEGPSESPRESPPPSPKEDQPQSPPMGEQPQPERKIELCTPDIVDLPI